MSHGLSLQRQLSCSFPPDFTPTHPAVHHPPPLEELRSIPLPFQASPPPRETVFPESEGFSALALPCCHPHPTASAQVTRRWGLLSPPTHPRVPRSSLCIMQTSPPCFEFRGLLCPRDCPDWVASPCSLALCLLPGCPILRRLSVSVPLSRGCPHPQTPLLGYAALLSSCGLLSVPSLALWSLGALAHPLGP